MTSPTIFVLADEVVVLSRTRTRYQYLYSSRFLDVSTIIDRRSSRPSARYVGCMVAMPMSALGSSDMLEFRVKHPMAAKDHCSPKRTELGIDSVDFVEILY